MELPDVPGIDHPMWRGAWPEWVEGFRPHQWDAAQEVLEAYQSGAKVVYLNAPTGSGKTLIGEMVRRLRVRPGRRALYVCHGLALQDQFVRDFPYANVLKGKSNYPTQLKPWPEWTAEDCTFDPGRAEAGCEWCTDKDACAYTVAKGRAVRGELAVVNVSYLLAETNHVGHLSGRNLVIADEADVLEAALMGHVEFAVRDRQLAALKLTAPKKGSHKATIARWMRDELVPTLEAKLKTIPRPIPGMPVDVKRQRERGRLQRLLQEAKRVAGEIESENWVRDNGSGGVVLKPVTVSEYGWEELWRHGEEWLCMSATIISSDEMSRSLGLDAAGSGWATVDVPMTFPIENRPIITVPVANMIKAEQETAWPKMARAVQKVMEMHSDDRILVHTVSYALAAFLERELDSDRVLTYASAHDRARVLAQYERAERSVLLAPSMDRGVDFRDDLARVVIVAKIPYPYLGDAQVSARSNGPGGRMWYAVQTVRSLVQMTGRGVRSAEDWCTTYVLDGQFQRLYREHKSLFPGWWREAIDPSFNPKKLLA